MSGPVVLNNRSDITLRTYEAVAWRGAAVTLGDAARARIVAARDSFMRLIDEPGVYIYGVTSGYGQLAHLKLTPEQRRAHAARAPIAANTGFGAPYPERVPRGITLTRLANYLEGHAAVSPAVAENVAEMLSGPMPSIPSEGYGGAGEIQTLAALFGAAAEGWDLREKDSLALVNGAPCAAALSADAVLAARRRLALAEALFALSLEALKAPMEAYDPALEALWEDPHEAAALGALRSAVAGGAIERRGYQAPVSWRILPRVLGRARRALAQAEEAATISIRAVSDNPVYLPPDASHPNGRVLSNGGYQDMRAPAAMDGLAAACADLTRLAERHADKLLDGRVSGLPDQLPDPEVADGGFEGGSNRGYMGCLPMASAWWSEQAARAARPSLLAGSESGGYGQNDMAPTAFAAWRQLGRVGECLDAGLAILGVVAAQAFHATDRAVPEALTDLRNLIREEAAPLTSQRALGPEVGRLAERFTARVHDPDAPAIGGAAA